MGIEHVLLPDEGLVVPGDLVIGADSHTCTYAPCAPSSTGVGSTDLAAAMFSGEVWLKVPETLRVVLSGRPRSGRGEGRDPAHHRRDRGGRALYRRWSTRGTGSRTCRWRGASPWRTWRSRRGEKTGSSRSTRRRRRTSTEGEAEIEVVTADPDARYADEISVDLSALEPVVAFPTFRRTRGLCRGSETSRSTRSWWVVHERADRDLRSAAAVIRGGRFTTACGCSLSRDPGDLSPGDAGGLMEAFVTAGRPSPPPLRAVPGGHMGILAAGERAISTTNRNFVGRMGHPESEVYLSTPRGRGLRGWGGSGGRMSSYVELRGKAWKYAGRRRHGVIIRRGT